MRASFAIAALAVAGASSAGAATVGQRLLLMGSTNIPQQAAPTPAPQQSTFFGYDNSWKGGTYNAGITLPAGGAGVGPQWLPGTGVNAAWVSVIKFHFDDHALGSASQTFMLESNCSATGCASGSDSYFRLSNMLISSSVLARTRELQFLSNLANLPIWTAPAGLTGNQTGIQLLANTNYCAIITQPTFANGGKVQIDVVDTTGAEASGSPSVSSATDNTSGGTNFYYPGTSTPRTQAKNLFTQIGTDSTTTVAFSNGTTGPISDVAMFWGSFSGGTGPTAPQAAALCNGTQDITTWGAAQGLTLKSLYRLNDVGTWAGDASGTFTTAATAFGTGAAASIVAAAPLTPNPCLALTEQGPGDVFRVEPGQWGGGATGTIYFHGTASASGCGFTPKGIQGEVLSAGSPVAGGWHDLKLTGSAISGGISGVPAGGPYTISIRPKASRAYVLAGKYPVYVGWKIFTEGQSQTCFMNLAGSGGGGTGSNISPTGTFNAGYYYPSDGTATIGTSRATAHPELIPLDAVNAPGGNSGIQQIGDGEIEFANDLTAANGWPVQIISFCKSGNAADSWTYDFVPFTTSLTASGGNTAFAATTLFSGGGVDPTLGGLIPGAAFVGSLGSVNVPGNILMTVLKGSVSLVDNLGATIATDNGAGIFTGANVSAAGTINYLTGAIAGLTFTGAQSVPVVAHWTNIEDTGGGSYVQSSPYTGFGTFGDGVTASSGLVTGWATRISGPPSMFVGEQCTSNSGEVANLNPPGSNASGGFLSLQAKWDWTLFHKYPTLGWWNANTPVMVVGYPRDPGKTAATMGGCNQFLKNFGAYAGSGPSAGMYHWGGDYPDNLNQYISLPTGVSPHPGPWPSGGRRVARRWATNAICVQGGGCGANAEPTITGAVRSGQTITFTVTLPNGGALTDCGTNFSNSLTTPSLTANTCSPPGTPVGTAVTGVRLGLSNTSMFNVQGWDSGNSLFNDAKQFTCQIASATTFTCTSAANNWFAANMYWTYAQEPLWKAGAVKPLTITGGSGYTGAGATVTGAGGTCTTHPTATVSQSGGVVTAVRVTPGVACTGTDTFPLTGLATGTGASVTGTFYTTSDDMNDVGELLYDNFGGYGGFEPGNVVAPVDIPQGPLS